MAVITALMRENIGRKRSIRGLAPVATMRVQTAAYPVRTHRTPPRTAYDNDPAPSAVRAARRRRPVASRRASAWRNLSIAVIRHDGVPAGGDDEDRLADAAGKLGSSMRAHGAKRSVAPGDRRSAEGERRLRLKDGRVAGKAHRDPSSGISGEGTQIKNAVIAAWHIHAAEAAEPHHTHSRPAIDIDCTNATRASAR